MYTLKINKHQCNGKQCSMCESALPNFLSEHGGSILISETNLEANREKIEDALRICPTGALELESV